MRLEKKLGLRTALLLATMISLVLPGCDPIDVSTPIHGPGDVYFAGAQRSSVDDTTLVSAYWKNGVPVTLTQGARYDRVIDIVVSGSDVHVIGYDGHFLMYWKNGVATNLGDSLASAYQLCVSNGDTYILARSGRNLGGPVVIKNGVPSFIKLQGLTSKTAADCITMAVSGNDVYLGGSISGVNGISPMVWKNGAPMITTGVAGWISDIAISGNDVYASATLFVGTHPMEAAYWKNGQLNMLTDETRSAGATAIVVSAGDVYVSGWETVNNVTMAKYWKNGTDTILPFSASCQADEIALNDHDVYVSGMTVNGDGILWKNGEIMPPFTGTNDEIFGANLWVY